MKVLVTGVAGFIGMHVAAALLSRGDTVVGFDNLNDYYDPALKQARLAELQAHPAAARFQFQQLDIVDQAGLQQLFKAEAFDAVIHLAAQAGVRYSITNPQSYIQSNLVGFGNMLEACRAVQIKHLVYASSSSVYGGNDKLPFDEDDAVDHPVSLYAATKKSNELMAHAYSHLYGIPTTGLRFFTVYGPWGRPDMAPMLFADAITQGRPITVFNHGQMQRDFTYISDIVRGVIGAMDQPPAAQPKLAGQPYASSGSWAPYRVLNIGRSDPVPLMDFIGTLQSALGIDAKLNFQPMQPGDVVATAARTDKLERLTGQVPRVSLAEGVAAFVAWYRNYYPAGAKAA